MQLYRVMVARTDAWMFQECHKSFAIVGTHHVQVVHRAGPGSFVRTMDRIARSFEQAIVLSCPRAALLIPLRQVRELHMEKSSLDGVETPVITLNLVVVLLRLSVVADHPNLGRKICVIRGDSSSFSARAQVFPGIEAERSGPAH